MSGRMAHARAILGEELFSRLDATKVLLVGAGGIGCELLKNLVLAGFGNITLLDLDTIDLSNLNRQFLFRKKDVKQSKALTAAATAGPFNPNVRITPIHGNIKDQEYDVLWFQQFDIVLNALDNLDARTHTNKMCMAAGVPLVESGTAGYLGQVQPIVKDTTECFSCNPHDTPKTFPVCTIRSTPSQPIHCIVWAKSYLMSQLFAEDEDAAGSSELDEALKQGENAQEIATLRAESQAFANVRNLLREPSKDGGRVAAKLVFDKIYTNDIKNLLRMADMWKSRDPPTPLDWDGISAGTFQLPLPNSSNTPALAVNGKPSLPGSSATESLLTNGSKGSTSKAAEKDLTKLRDQRVLTLQENLDLFIESTTQLSKRLQSMIAHTKNGPQPTINFDKDDPDTLDFVTAASNLRSAAYGIPGKTRWEVKEMAGNIIPAIATTNAMISGLIVLQALNILASKAPSASSTAGQFGPGRMKLVNLVSKPQVQMMAYTCQRPNERCGVCRDTYVAFPCDPARTTLGDVVNGVLGSSEDNDEELEFSTFEGARMLSDPDWDDNLSKTLESLQVTQGKFLTVVDDSDGDSDGTVRGTMQLGIVALPKSYTDSSPFILPDPLPQPPRRSKASMLPPQEPSPVKMTITKAAQPPPKGVKRPAPDSSTEELRTPKKRRMTASASPKKQAFEEDGLVILDDENDNMEINGVAFGDDDVIEIELD